MLYTNTVKPATYALLKKLMQIEELSDFAIVGGTNLSLKLGHRISIDLDLFTNKPFDREEVERGIIKQLPQAIKLDQRKQSIWFYIDDVKVDVILHEYEYIEPLEVIDGIRFVSIPDIVPMKLEAMATRGVKKDFWDIAELLNHYTLVQMLEFYQRKYPKSDIGHIILSMTYFVDAEKQEEDPEGLKGVKWKQVKAEMKKAVTEYVRDQI